MTATILLLMITVHCKKGKEWLKTKGRNKESGIEDWLKYMPVNEKMLDELIWQFGKLYNDNKYIIILAEKIHFQTQKYYEFQHITNHYKIYFFMCFSMWMFMKNRYNFAE